MRKVTKEFNVYKYSELSEESKKKVVEKWRDEHDTCFPIDDVIDAWKEKLEGVYGLDNELKIYYSGFSSQGDGACFVVKPIYNFDKFIEAMKDTLTEDNLRFFKIVKDNDIELSLEIPHRGHYYHEHSAFVNLDINTGHVDSDDYRDFLEANYTALETMFESWRYQTSKEIYREIEKTWNEWNSREIIEDDIECSEVEFLENGKAYNE